MPSPPSTHPSHAQPLSPPDRLTSQRTSLLQWMAHHHLPFSALTISDPPTPSARELVLVSAVVGRGMFGSARLEIVVPRAEVRRVERESGGEDKADETGVEVREVTPRGDSAARVEGPVVGLGWGGTRMRRESASSGDEGGTGWSGGDDGGILVEAHEPLPIFRRAVPPTVNVHHHDRHHNQTTRRLPHPTVLPSSSGGILSIRCGISTPAGPSPSIAPNRVPSPTYLLPNPAFPRLEPATSTVSTCAGRLVLELPLHPARNTAHSPQQADFAFGPGTPSGRKHARGWILDAREMEGYAGQVVFAGDSEDEGWGKIVCGCARGGGLEVVGCLGCGSPLGVWIQNPCSSHALRSPSPGSPHPGPTPIWFIPHQLADVHYPPIVPLEPRRMIGR